MINYTFKDAFNFYQKRQFLKSEEICKKILEVSPNNFEVINLYAVLLFQKKNYIEAITFFNKAIKINPRRPDLYNNLSIALFQEKKYKEAIISWDNAIKIKPDYAEAFFNKGNVYSIIKDYKNSIKSFEEAIKIKKNYKEAYSNLGNVYVEIKDYEKALEKFDLATKINPINPIEYNNIGNIYFELKNFKKALENFDNALSVNANFALSYYNKAKTYKEINQNNKAVFNYEKAISLNKNFIERINILGNFITDEKVIRNTLIIDEGDAFNDVLFDKSIQKVKAKNIFKSVNYKITSSDDLNKEIDITVEEKPTGEIFAGAGTGTTGTSLTAGIKEANYLGLGIKLDTNIVLSDDSIKGKFQVINPNYNNSDKSIKTSFESSTNDFMSTSGYKTSRTGFSIGTEFEQMNDLFVNFELSNFYEDLETTSSATEIVKKQEGNYIENLIMYSLKFNRLDQDFQPTDGFITNFSQILPIYSDDLSIENIFTSSLYHSLGNNMILSANYFLKTINSLEDNVRISKRVFVPSRRLRGFESGKIGPKDGSQYIGGNYATALNLNSTFPNVLFEKENLDLNFFIDLANVWEVDYNDSLDSNKIRSSTGIAVNWFSAIGPLTFSYAIPLSDTDSDVTESFRFQIGTSF